MSLASIFMERSQKGIQSKRRANILKNEEISKNAFGFYKEMIKDEKGYSPILKRWLISDDECSSKRNTEEPVGRFGFVYHSEEMGDSPQDPSSNGYPGWCTHHADC
jgi:hypothetical protein